MAEDNQESKNNISDIDKGSFLSEVKNVYSARPIVLCRHVETERDANGVITRGIGIGIYCECEASYGEGDVIEVSITGEVFNSTSVSYAARVEYENTTVSPIVPNGVSKNRYAGSLRFPKDDGQDYWIPFAWHAVFNLPKKAVYKFSVGIGASDGNTNRKISIDYLNLYIKYLGNNQF